jgi:hypothetical protein
MRARNIKPAFFSDVDLAEKCTREARLLFVGLWCLADCMGRLEDRPRWIKAEIFPYDDDLTTDEVHLLLRELDEGGFISRYTVKGDDYIVVNNFVKHQNPHKKERESGSAIPSKELAESRPEPELDREIPGPDREIPERAVLIPDSCFLIPDIPQPEILPDANLDPKPTLAVSRATVTPALSKREFSEPDPMERFEANFKGEWLADTWREFPKHVNTPELIEALDINTPMWMQTAKYRGGYGKDSVWFLRSGVWKKPPPREMLAQQSGGFQKPDGLEYLREKLRKAEEKERGAA